MIASEARGAWQDIERRLRPYVTRRVASPGDVEDILQEIFVRIHRGLSALRDGESFGGWVYRIAQSCIGDAARARARTPLQLVDEMPEMAAPTDDASDNLEDELGACVALFVARLPAPYREAVTLTELEGLTQKEAAELLGVTLPAMKSRASRGREKIRDMFEECCRITVDRRGRVTACEPLVPYPSTPSCAFAARGVEARSQRLQGDETVRSTAAPSAQLATKTNAINTSTFSGLQPKRL
jgi:RNA polymerase sigma-70 factor (ECF subfamily)